MQRGRGFTLIELMVAVAVVAILLTLAAPSFYDYIRVQRLKSVNAQLVTDLQLARSEAASRNRISRVMFREGRSLTCYSLYTLPPMADAGLRCNCLLGPGAACGTSDAAEIRTVQVAKSSGVKVLPAPLVDPAIGFDPTTGGLMSIPSDTDPAPLNSFVISAVLDADRTLRTEVGQAGRVTVCGVSGQLGAPPC